MQPLFFRMLKGALLAAPYYMRTRGEVTLKLAYKINFLGGKLSSLGGEEVEHFEGGGNFPCPPDETLHVYVPNEYLLST